MTTRLVVSAVLIVFVFFACDEVDSRPEIEHAGLQVLTQAAKEASRSYASSATIPSKHHWAWNLPRAIRRIGEALPGVARTWTNGFLTSLGPTSRALVVHARPRALAFCAWVQRVGPIAFNFFAKYKFEFAVVVTTVSSVYGGYWYFFSTSTEETKVQTTTQELDEARNEEAEAEANVLAIAQKKREKQELHAKKAEEAAKAHAKEAEEADERLHKRKESTNERSQKQRAAQADLEAKQQRANDWHRVYALATSPWDLLMCVLGWLKFIARLLWFLQEWSNYLCLIVIVIAILSSVKNRITKRDRATPILPVREPAQDQTAAQTAVQTPPPPVQVQPTAQTPPPPVGAPTRRVIRRPKRWTERELLQHGYGDEAIANYFAKMEARIRAAHPNRAAVGICH